MHLYLIIYISGHVALAMRWGSDALDDCIPAKVGQEAEIDNAFRVHSADDPVWVVDGHRNERKDIIVSCEFRATPPDTK